MHDRVQESRRPPPVTCWLVGGGDIFIWSVFLFCLSFSCRVCLTGSWWSLPVWLSVSFRPLRNSRNQLTWLSSTWKDWSSSGSPSNSFSGNVTFFKLRPFWHSTTVVVIIAMSFPLHKFELSYSWIHFGTGSYYILRSWFLLRPILILSGLRFRSGKKDWRNLSFDSLLLLITQRRSIPI